MFNYFQGRIGGQKGEQGEIGLKGDKGDIGLKGEKGERGADGFPGVPGTNGLHVGITCVFHLELSWKLLLHNTNNNEMMTIIINWKQLWS